MTESQLRKLQERRKAKTATNDTTTINVDLPSELHRRFKAACVLERLTLSQAVTQAVADWVKERGQ